MIKVASNIKIIDEETPEGKNGIEAININRKIFLLEILVVFIKNLYTYI